MLRRYAASSAFHHLAPPNDEQHEDRRRHRGDEVGAAAARRVERFLRRNERLARRGANDRHETGQQQRRQHDENGCEAARQRQASGGERRHGNDGRARAARAGHGDVHAVRPVRHQPELPGVEAVLAGNALHRVAGRRAGDPGPPEHGPDEHTLHVGGGGALRTTTSASPGTTSGGRTITRTGYGPAAPSNTTFGLPTCADATTATISANAAPAMRLTGARVASSRRDSARARSPPWRSRS